MNTNTVNIATEVPANLRWLLNNFRAKHRGLEHCLNFTDDHMGNYDFPQRLITLLKSDELPVPIDWVWDIHFAFNSDGFLKDAVIKFPHLQLQSEVLQLSRLLYRSQRFGRLLELSPISPLGISKKIYLSLLFADVATFLISPQNPAEGHKWKPNDFRDWPDQATQMWPVPLSEDAQVQFNNCQRSVDLGYFEYTDWRYAVNTLRASTHIEALTSFVESYPGSVAAVVAIGEEEVEVIFHVGANSKEAWEEICNDIQQEFEAAHAPISTFDHQTLATVPWTKDGCDLIFLNEDGYVIDGDEDEEEGDDQEEGDHEKEE